MGFPFGSVVKNVPAMQEPQEMQVQSLSQEDPLEEAMATHSSILAWRIPCTEEPGGLQVYRVTKSRTRLKQLSRQTHKDRSTSNLIGGIQGVIKVLMLKNSNFHGIM